MGDFIDSTDAQVEREISNYPSHIKVIWLTPRTVKDSEQRYNLGISQKIYNFSILRLIARLKSDFVSGDQGDALFPDLPSRLNSKSS